MGVCPIKKNLIETPQRNIDFSVEDLSCIRYIPQDRLVVKACLKIVKIVVTDM